MNTPDHESEPVIQDTSSQTSYTLLTEIVDG